MNFHAGSSIRQYHRRPAILRSRSRNVPLHHQLARMRNPPSFPLQGLPLIQSQHIAAGHLQKFLGADSGVLWGILFSPIYLPIAVTGIYSEKPDSQGPNYKMEVNQLDSQKGRFSLWPGWMEQDIPPKAMTNTAVKSKKLSSYPAMKMIVWNTRGCGNGRCFMHVKDLVRIHQQDVMLLLETKVMGPAAVVACDAVNMTNMHRIDGNGSKGGLWLFWNARAVAIDVVHENAQAIHAIIQVSSSSFSSSWFFSGIYGSPNRIIRNQIWSELKHSSSVIDLPWLLAGDFNEIISLNPVLAAPLLDCISTCNFEDLGFSGGKYTWTNCRYNREDLIFERLNRAFANPSWFNLFRHVSVTHLPRTHSDHHPIFLSLSTRQQLSFSSTFKFESYWMLLSFL